MNSLNKSLDAIAKPFLGITPWLLRLSLGISFFLHGYGKLPLPPQNLVKWFESGGMPAPDVVASAVSIGEMSAGIGIIVGGFFANNLGNFITRQTAEIASKLTIMVDSLHNIYFSKETGNKTCLWRKIKIFWGPNLNDLALF